MENQPRLKNFNMNLISTCNIFTKYTIFFNLILKHALNLSVADFISCNAERLAQKISVPEMVW